MATWRAENPERAAEAAKRLQRKTRAERRAGIIPEPLAEKRCTKCGKVKPVAEFSGGEHTRSGLHSWCRQCNSANSVAWNKAHPERFNRNQRTYWLKAHYGLTRAQFDALMEAQGGVCAICGGQPDRRNGLAVDHNHKTGEVRGLLCFKCNTTLGQVSDNSQLLHRAIEYLTRVEQQSFLT